MNTSTILGLKYGAIAVVIYLATAFAVINLLWLRPDFVFMVLGILGLPAVSAICCRAGYKGGRSGRMAIEIRDA
jgi:hypothetical protein